MGAGCCGKKKQVRKPEYRPVPPYTQFTIKKTNLLVPIDGYLNEPLLPLEEALKPMSDRIDLLAQKIKEAKGKCHFPSEHGLTHDESAAIYIYTMRWENRCVYDQLQTALNTNDSTALKPWFRYLRLLKSALDKLPNVKTTVWQGTEYNERLKEQLNSKSSIFYTPLCSCSTSSTEILDYFRRTTDKKIMLIGYQSVHGKSIVNYTANTFQEVVLWPGMKVGVSKSSVVDNYYSWILHSIKDIEQPPPKPVAENAVKHFKCPYKYCDNVCACFDRPDRCYTYLNMSHTCHHHCSVSYGCSNCGKVNTHLCRCDKCGGYYCTSCCFK